LLGVGIAIGDPRSASLKRYHYLITTGHGTGPVWVGLKRENAVLFALAVRNKALGPLGGIGVKPEPGQGHGLVLIYELPANRNQPRRRRALAAAA